MLLYNEKNYRCVSCNHAWFELTTQCKLSKDHKKLLGPWEVPVVDERRVWVCAKCGSEVEELD